MKVIYPVDVPYAHLTNVAEIPNERVLLRCSDGDVEVWMREAVFLRIIWEPLFVRGISLCCNDIPKTLFPINKKTGNQLLSEQYAKILDLIPNIDHVSLMVEYMYVIYHLQYVPNAQFGAYTTSIDLVDLLETLESPELDSIVREPLKIERGVSYVEKELRRRGEILMKLIATPRALSVNKIWHHAVSGAFKNDQFPQLCIAYGPRSDITDEILPHIMQCSGISGMRSLEDMCTESASAKKSTHNNTTIIKDSQTLHKNLKLASSSLTKMYSWEESCTSDASTRTLLDHHIKTEYTDRYVDKICFIDGKQVAITKANHKTFAGKKVQFISPVYCCHHDGVCAKCAGVNTKHVWKYKPRIKLGKYVMSEMFRKISQDVLSTKHIVMVFLAAIKMTKKATEVFTITVNEDKGNDTVCLTLSDKAAAEYNNGYLTIPVEDIGHPKDLLHSSAIPIEFGVIHRCGIIHDPTERPNTFALDEGSSRNTFSKDFFEYIKLHSDEILCPPPGTRHKNIYCIPLYGWDVTKPVFDVMEINDDMAAYVNNIDMFFKTRVSSYSSIPDAIQAFTDFLYKKSNTNFFLVEILFKAFLMSATNNPDTRYEKLKDRVGLGTGARMSFGYLRQYIEDPKTATMTNAPVDIDSQFGWLMGDNKWP